MFEGAYSDDTSEEDLQMGYTSASSGAPVFHGVCSDDAAGIGAMLVSADPDNDNDDLDVPSGYRRHDVGRELSTNAASSESIVAHACSEVGRLSQLVPWGFPKVKEDATPYTTTVFGMGAIVLLPESEHKYASVLTNVALANGKVDSFPDHEVGEHYTHIFSKRLKTDSAHRATPWGNAAAEANASQIADKNSGSRYRGRFLETAEAVMASSRLLGASYAAKLLNMITGPGQKWRGLMLTFQLQGDEATKEMRIPDETEPSDPSLHAITDNPDAEHEDNKRKAPPSIVVTAKVQYSELRVSCLIERIESGHLVHTSLEFPCTLQHFDRTTSHNLTPAQEDLIKVPGFSTNEFMAAFKHVGVLPTQDKSGGNEKQVNCAGIVDRKPIHGNKRRFRVAMCCGVHGWARCMTSQFHIFDHWVTGAIAYAITQRGANKLPELRRIVGDRLVVMCQGRIHRNTSPQTTYIYIYRHLYLTPTYVSIVPRRPKPTSCALSSVVPILVSPFPTLSLECWAHLHPQSITL